MPLFSSRWAELVGDQALLYEMLYQQTRNRASNQRGENVNRETEIGETQRKSESLLCGQRV